ncbi:MAG: protein kinase [Deltaproteobacteria bacterium]|nr:protein kinase [Deltaproteobacteria bacterium]
MQPGTVLADRFEVIALVGRGGMSSVYRAFDRRSKTDVALKLLGERYTHESERFGREAIALQGLRHPNVVRYVAHGRTDEDTHYLAMEWLDGEDLASRLKRGPLSMSEAVALAARIASALAAAHARGIVHRDVKPSNIFLPSDSLDRVKILDFGIARFGDRDGLTAPGVVFGTLGYMAPEQARGERVINGRADLFALGCVLYECITGRPVFVASQPTAVLAKVVFEDAPRLRAVKREVPEALDRLVARMLAKVPASRPGDARALAAELDALGRAALEAEEAPAASAKHEAIGESEQRIVAVILTHLIESRIESRMSDATLPLTTAEHESTASRLMQIRAAVAPYDAKIELLRNGSLVATFVGKGDAAELVSRAARCALSIREKAPDVPMVVATGRGVLGGRLPVGEVIDEAADLLRAATGGARHPSTPPFAFAGSLPGARIEIDATTAALLETRFDVARSGGSFVLRGEREQVEPTRTLLGRETPCVGRDRELSLLRMYVDECVDEPVARAVLVTAPAGFGKSRVCWEFGRALRQSHPEAEVWSCRGDPIGAGSPFAMIAQLLRSTASLRDGEPLEVRRAKLRGRVAQAFASRDSRGGKGDKHVLRVTWFLGEIVGARFPDESHEHRPAVGDSLQLRAARQDPILMGDQMQQAWEDFLDAETARRPLVLVLEDLQWGDLPSVQLIDAALRTLRERPLLVLALSRPEVHELFPRLWAGRGVQEIRLGELTRKASEKLVRDVLADRLTDEQVARLVDRAAGNAFYLEELIRAASEGSIDNPPSTIVAMAQSRLERLEPDGRRVLRAASVFGQVFWRSGVMALLGGEAHGAALDGWLEELVERETISRGSEGKFPGEQEYVFRHALVRDAAYAMLTEGDARLGHQLAARWLEGVGESDATTMAEHFERGGEPARAMEWWRRAAEQALGGNDYDAVVARAERAVACGATGEVFGALRVMQAEAHRWRGDLAGAEACSLDAMRLLPRGSPQWFNATGELAVASGRRGKPAQLSLVSQMLVDLGKQRAVSGAHAIAAVRASIQLLLSGKQDFAAQLLDLLATVQVDVLRKNPAVAARIAVARYYRAICGGDPASGVELAATAAELFERAGDLRNACVQRGDMAYAQVELGAYEQARSTFREVLGLADRLGRLWHASATAKHNLGMVLARLGAYDEARAIETEALDAFRTRGDRRMEGRSRIFLAEISLLAGDLEGATREAQTAVKTLSVAPPAKAHALAVAAQVELARGDHEGALADALEADRLLQKIGALDEGEAVVRLVHAEALHAAGRFADACAAIDAARRRLLERAGKIRDESLRRSFLEQVPENARTLALAAVWGVESPPEPAAAEA